MYNIENTYIILLCLIIINLLISAFCFAFFNTGLYCMYSFLALATILTFPFIAQLFISLKLLIKNIYKF